MLLPPNATKQEKALVDAIDYKVDPGCIRGFKFSPGEKVLPWMGMFKKVFQTAFLTQLNFQSAGKEDIKLRYS